MPGPSEIERAANEFRASLLAAERSSATEMVRAYGDIWAKQRRQIDALLKQIADAQAKGQTEAPFTPRQPGGDAIPRPPGTYSPSWSWQLSRIESMQRQVEAELARFAQFADSTITAQQQQAVDAAQTHAEQLARISLGEPPPGVSIRWDRVPTSALTDLVGTLQDGSPLKTLLDTLGPDVSAGMRKALITGLATGQNPRAIASLVRRQYGMGLARALVISRTEVMRSYRSATSKSMLANQDILRGWYRHSALGLRTCAACFPAGVLVSTRGVEKVFSRYYTGDVVVIQMASGKDLTVTPNHLILTPRGWVHAGRLQVGDDVVRRSYCEGALFGVDIDDNNVPIPIEQVAESLGMVAAEMECTAPDFHGDGVGSDVYVVWTNRLLGNDSDPSISQHSGERLLSGGSMAHYAEFGLGLPVQCGGNTLFERDLVGAGMVLEHGGSFAQGDIGCSKRIGFSESSPFDPAKTNADRDNMPSDIIGFGQTPLGFPGEIAPGNLFVGNLHIGMITSPGLSAGIGPLGGLTTKQPTFFEDSGEPLGANAESGTDLLRRLSGYVRLDRILHVYVRCFSGHVYNLQTESGFYEANSIIAHNCYALHGSYHKLTETLQDHPAGRCRAIPLVKDWAQLGFKGIPDKRASIESGPDRFAKMPDEQQLKVLGKAKYQAYKDGTITLPDLVGYSRSKAWGVTPREVSLRDALDAAAKRGAPKGVKANPVVVAWKPTGTQAEVDAWAKDSKIPETLYHSTSNADSIRREGFRLDVPVKNGRILGDGVYVGDLQTAKDWKGDGEVLAVRVNVHNPATYEDINRGRKVPMSFMGQSRPAKYVPGEDGSLIWSVWDWIEELGREHFPTKLGAERIAAVLQEMGIDAVIDGRRLAGTVVFDPKNIMVIVK